MTGYSVDVRIGGASAGTARVALPLSITHGRSGVGTQPDAPTCSFTWLGSNPPGAIGDPVEVDAEILRDPVVYDDSVAVYDSETATYDNVYPREMAPRFRGFIAGMAANEIGGNVTSWDIDAVGGQARLGYIPVVLSRPAETDVARVAAIATAASVSIEIRGPAGPVLAADNIDRDALGALHQICESSGGLVWQAPDGTIVYGTAEHRSEDPVGTLDAEIIGNGISWTEQVEQVINHITVEWGPESTRTQNTFQDSDSIAEAWGRRHLDVSTICAAEADAEQLALLILRRNSYPFWSTPGAVLHGDKMTGYDNRLLALLDVSSAVLVPITRDPGPTPGDQRGAIVEGWVESWESDGYTVQIALSDTARWVTTRVRTYAEAKAGGSYAYWKTGSYLDLLIVEGVPV